MSTIPQISPAEASDLLKAQGPKAVLLDVRETWELALAHVEGAMHIPMGDVQDKLAELNSGLTYVVMCHHGRRSQQVAAYLAANGFQQVLNVAGGIDAWAETLDPDLPRY